MKIVKNCVNLLYFFSYITIPITFLNKKVFVFNNIAIAHSTNSIFYIYIVIYACLYIEVMDRDTNITKKAYITDQHVYLNNATILHI